MKLDMKMEETQKKTKEEITNEIIETLISWETRFPAIRMRYAYDDISEYHIIEITGPSYSKGSEDYEKAEVELWFEISPHADLLITEPSEANNMSNVLWSNLTNSEDYAWSQVLQHQDYRDCQFWNRLELCRFDSYNLQDSFEAGVASLASGVKKFAETELQKDLTADSVRVLNQLLKIIELIWKKS